jgi:hypothetical protein
MKIRAVFICRDRSAVRPMDFYRMLKGKGFSGGDGSAGPSFDADICK